jgi:hypothetical protein
MTFKNVQEYYYFDFSKVWDGYLRESKIKFSKIEDNLICVKLDPVNHETELKALLEGYDKWVKDNQYDRSVFPNAKGSMYHRL